MTSRTTPRFLHVANGSSTTMTIEAAGIAGMRSIWADPLHDGPVPGGLSDDELVEVRRRHLEGPLSTPENDLRTWRRVIAQHDAYDELILWFEHDLFDQLNLIQLLAWIRERLPPNTLVTLICIGSFPGRPGFKGLGELTADELATLLDIRRRVSADEYAVAERAWHAFRQPTPEALDELLRTDTSAMPYLADALTRFLEEYPWIGDGLSRTERRLLELADGDGIALWQSFPRMGDGERFYHVTGESLAELAEDLSSTPPPLLRLDLTGDSEAYILRGSVTLTATGRSVLAGDIDRVATCGIDRWLGGVHLHDGAVDWRWDPEQQRVIARE